ncbi:hypothetical protein V491_00197 [Pseudogymnoascus sp. VKM F-3775]|nr:hypothetical protein V491_00197 [Pseudogymnoascus sp. VKM F-3775]
MQNNSASEVAQVHPASISMSISDNGRSIASQILAIVGDEAGIPVSDLGPRSIFADLGIDSLLSLTIISRIREELELEVPSTLFSDNLTVKALMETFSSRRDPSTAPSTPEKYTSSEASSSDVRTDYTPTPDDYDIMSTIRLVLAEEIGVEIGELTRFLVLSELGMDSLLALTVMAKLRELLCIELPLDLFVRNGTLDEVESALGVMRKLEPMTPTTFSVSVPSFTPKATSVLLQGTPKLAKKTLFLFPDGSGSSTSYSLLPQISPTIAVYGLNCPYMKTPENMKCSIEELCSIYLEEVCRQQPHGPYHFGGWSAGGICAYEAAQQPNPIGIENPPIRLYDFFNSIGVIGSSGKEAPEWLRRHFTAFMAALDRYNAVPFSETSVPKTAIIWAADGVCKHPDDPRPVMTDNDPKEMRWLLNNRTDTGSNWRINLLSGDKMTIKMMDGVNHFTMLAGEKANELSDFMKKAMLQ